MVRKIAAEISDEVFEDDLERYRKRAIELGATDAKVISSDFVIIDERVRAKCIYPKCDSYGTNAHCPPYSMAIDDVRKLVAKYKAGIFIDFRVSSDLVAGPRVAELGLNIPSGLKMHEIVAKLEAEAFYDGYHLALGFALGACKLFYCSNEECSALIQGQGCRHPLRARASMEGMGMNVYTMAAKIGWDIDPIGRRTKPEDVPCGHRFGLVLIN